LFHPKETSINKVLAGRLGTLAWGAAATVAALFAGRLGPLVNAFNVIYSFLGGPILGIFLLGMLTKRAKSNATMVGGAAGLISVVLIAFKTDVSFFYFAVIGLVVTMVVGYSLSLAGQRQDPATLTGLVYGLENAELLSKAGVGANPGKSG